MTTPLQRTFLHRAQVYLDRARDGRGADAKVAILSAQIYRMRATIIELVTSHPTIANLSYEDISSMPDHDIDFVCVKEWKDGDPQP